MGAYNVKSNKTTTDDGCKDAGTTDSPKDSDKDIVTEDKEIKKHDDKEEERGSEGSPYDGEDNLEETAVDKKNDDERVVEVKTTERSAQEDNTEDKNDAVQAKTKKKGEKRNTEDTIMAARERYLARKRLKQETQL